MNAQKSIKVCHEARQNVIRFPSKAKKMIILLPTRNLHVAQQFLASKDN